MWLLEYREAIRKGEIIAGVEMITELDNLIDTVWQPLPPHLRIGIL